jgi:hypothetical protein
LLFNVSWSVLSEFAPAACRKISRGRRKRMVTPFALPLRAHHRPVPL